MVGRNAHQPLSVAGSIDSLLPTYDENVRILIPLAAVLLAVACSRKPMQPSAEIAESLKDIHSYGNPRQIAVNHVDLEIDVDFPRKILKGFATLSVLRSLAYPEGPLVLDTRDLAVKSTEASSDGVRFVPVRFELGTPDRILGAPLSVHLPAAAKFARIHYETRPAASGLQWLTPEQTAGKKHPYLFSQSQAIHARSWIPLQDSPGVRVTYSARVRVPPGMRALMSAENDPRVAADGQYRFSMPHPIPSYLIALAAGNIDRRSLSKRTAVYAEPPVLSKAAAEFDDMERMLEAAEDSYGPYRWSRYDVLVLPPSFPFGGMENPKLTFLTPTLLAGDRSLVAVVAHEAAHSWSGNLVTNATWSDFWLNEGFTTYIERRIQEKLYGPERAEMEALLERRELEAELKTLKPADQILYIDLKGRDPDDAVTQVAYVKGMLFLRSLEEQFGRDQFDSFLRDYFQNFAFKSITTIQFIEYLEKNLLGTNRSVSARIPVKQWIYEPGLPASAPLPKSDAFERVESLARSWLERRTLTAQLPAPRWTTHETLQFLRSLPQNLDRKRMAELDAVFHFTRSGNAEILQQWLLMSIRSHYETAYPKLESFLLEVGRRKYLKPLYQELASTPEGKKRALAIYAKARPRYHSIAQNTVDGLLK